MEKESIYASIFIPDEGLEVEIKQVKNPEGGEYWIVKFGDVAIFPDRDWLTYLASKIAVAMPAEEQDKIIDAIGDAENETILEESIEKAREEITNV